MQPLIFVHVFMRTLWLHKIFDGAEVYAISKLIGQIFSSEVNLSGLIHSLLKEATARKLDIKEETSPHLLADKDILIRTVLNLAENKGGLYVFDIPTVANVLHIQAGEVLDRLKNLKLSDEVTYELKDQAYYFTLVKKPNDLFALSAFLTKWLSQLEMYKVQKLDTMFKVLFASKECKGDSGFSGSLHTFCFQEHIIAYFSNKPAATDMNLLLQRSNTAHFCMQILSEVKSRALARIMHEIPNPAFHSSSWARNYLWGWYVEIDFQVVMEAAKIELMNFIKKSTEEN